VPPRKKQSTDAATPKTGRKKAPPKTKAAKKTTAAVAKATPDRRKKAEPAANGARRKQQNLVIVESPAKAKTIAKYLGPGFKVLASYGHVRDLPPKGKQRGEEVVGVRISEGWKPRYVIVDRSSGGKVGGRGRRSAEDILAELKREADKSNVIYLATDPDREGESIAWHISEALELEPARRRRIAFNEITRSAVQRALQNPSDINHDRVQAQEARRVLDRVVGYPLSNLLGKKVTRGLSAGRVQSVAVKLIVDREREIEAFKPEEYWKITALLAPQGTVTGYTPDPTKAKVYAKKNPLAAARDDSKAPVTEALEEEAAQPDKEKESAPKLPEGSFQAELARWQGKDFSASTEEQADAVFAILNTANYVVAKVEQRDELRRPPAPFTTSTLQQQANQRLRFSARHTMGVAQELYQGVQLGSEGAVALITYMRTDSTRVSDDALRMVREHIQQSYGPRYLPEQPNVYRSGKSAQEAHEAVRPTDLAYTPQQVQPYLSPDQQRLYTLIYNQFLASQMTPAIVAVTNVEVEAGPGVFKASGSVQKFDGYRRVLPPVKQEDKVLPALAEKQPLDKLDLTASQHFTQPPPRYNEASLVKALEKEGIGRPSTYATIISTIQQRGYVRQEHRRFFATEIGKLVTDLLVAHFTDVINEKFTSHIEEELDDIENGKVAYADVLTEFWKPFSDDLRKAETNMPTQKGQEIGEACPKCGRPLVKMYSKITGREFIGCSGWRDKENPCPYKRTVEGKEIAGPVETSFKCPVCGKPVMKKEGRFGEYLECSAYPECKTRMNIGPDGQPVVTSKPTEYKCDRCGSPMVQKQGPRGPFLGCSAYPKCRFTLNLDEHGNPIKPLETGEKCEKCGSPMAVKEFRGRYFLGCSAYPKCRSTKPLTEELKAQLKDRLPARAPKKEMPTVEVSEKCPQCGSPMKVCWARGRAFLGCTTWAKTKCKGTRPMTPEALERLQQVQAAASG
jgi:DNA topoisomerase I